MAIRSAQKAEGTAGGNSGIRRFVVGTLSVSLILMFLVVPALVGLDRASSHPVKADKVVVIKSKRIMMLLREGEIMRVYRVALGQKPEGHKVKAGDNRTPEGVYLLESRNRESSYHLSLRISYPNEQDLRNAQQKNVRPGGDIMIHGLSQKLATLGKLHRYRDWTNGCIAVTNPEIEEIWELVPDGTPIEIKP